MSTPLIIAVDFDGTLVEHAYPDIGADVSQAFGYLQMFQAERARLILWTMRDDDRDRPVLTEAVNYCRDRGVGFWGVNENPEQYHWSDSPKQFAHVYIDDAAFGCPLVHVRPMGGDHLRGTLRYDALPRPYVDWTVIGPKVLDLIRARRGA